MRAVAGVDQVSVAIDEPGRDPAAGAVDVLGCIETWRSIRGATGVHDATYLGRQRFRPTISPMPDRSDRRVASRAFRQMRSQNMAASCALAIASIAAKSIKNVPNSSRDCLAAARGSKDLQADD